MLYNLSPQGPLPTTTVDFWRMVWQERPQAIAMVTNLEEASNKKCHQYWPETGTKSFGPFKITITGQEILADYTTQHLSVEVSYIVKNVSRNTYNIIPFLHSWLVALNLL